MDVSDKSISSTQNQPPLLSKGTDENEQSYSERGLNVQILKKSITTPTPPKKHFMSPTVSAASKANPPRKKVLAERNESQDDTHLEKTRNIISKTTRKSTTSLDSRTTSVAEFGDNQENALIDDLSSRPYDPLTNYTSPRPKFLRYKPNRRREVFLGRENEVKQGKDGSLEPEKGARESNVEQQHEEIDDIDSEEFEEVNEERVCWAVIRGALKVLFLIGVLVFSTMYISSMNSPTPSPVVQAVASVKDGYHTFQAHVYGFVKNLDGIKLLLVNTEGLKLGFPDVEGFKKEQCNEDVKVKIYEAGIGDKLNEVLVEIQSGETKAAEMVDDVRDVLSEGGENEDMEIVEHEELGNVIERQAKEVLDTKDLEMAKTEEFLIDQVATSSEFQGLEAVEVLEMPLEIVQSAADATEKENEIIHDPIKEQIFDREIGGAEFITTDEAEVAPKERLLKHMETESIQLVIGLSVFSSIIASSALVLHFKKNRNARKVSDTILVPCFDSVTVGKCNSLLAKEEDMHIEQPVSVANSKSLMNSLYEEDSKQTHESRAPTVELLGELVVGEMSSSLRSCGMKSRMIESEVSSHSFSMEKGVVGSKNNSIPVHLQSAYSENSSMNLCSHPVEKMLKKEEEVGDEVEAKEEEVVTIPTPLRRSSRLRSRAMLSP